MAQVEKRIPLARAQHLAETFIRRLMPFCERAEIVGSVRRGRPAVADIEYVVIPRFEEKPGAGLFGAGDPVQINTLWRELDAQVDGLDEAVQHWGVTKALRGDPLRPCWGQKQRACWYLDTTHEIYLADAENWGSVQLIRTGPAEFSRHYVTELINHGLKHKDNRVIDVTQAGGPVVPTPTEQDAFDLIGIAYREPKDRVGVDNDRSADLR